MKRTQANRSSKVDSYEHVLMCLICRSLFDDHDHQPKFLPCHHTFCKDCLREFVRQMGDEIECPSCRKPTTIPAAGVAALQTNFYAKYIQSLVYGVGGIGCFSNFPGDTKEDTDPVCPFHDCKKAQYFCKQCCTIACESCFNEGGACVTHKKQPLAAAAEDFQGKIDTSFARANALIEQKKVELEARLKAFSEEKDRALLKIDAAFETHTHLLNRRATLLKNKVIDSYNERVTSFELDLEEISTAMTCIVSLKEFHETAISRGQLADVEKGVEELNEVYSNVEGRIHPRPYHVVFEDRHGTERFKSCVKDLGKVTCFAGMSSSNQKTAAASGDDDPPDTTPSSPHPPSLEDFPEDIDRRMDGNRRDSNDNEGGRPRPEGRRNGSTSDACSTAQTSDEGMTSNESELPFHAPPTFDSHNSPSHVAKNFRNVSCNDALDIISSQLQRPFSARVRKAFEKMNEEDDAVDRTNIKNLASPVRRPKFLISPDDTKCRLANKNKVTDLISSNII